MMPKKTLGLPSPPEGLFPSSSILSMAVICLPVYTASSSMTTSSSCDVRSILMILWSESDVLDATT